MKRIIFSILCFMVLFLSALSANEGQAESIESEYDVTVEAIIHADHEIVYQAILDEYDGETNWWLPDFSSRMLQGETSGTVGSLYEVTIHAIIPLKFKTRTVETKKGEMLRVEYAEGDFAGKGLWLFEDKGGETRVSLLWQTNPGSYFMHMMAPFHSAVVKGHTKVMQAGFDRLNKYLVSDGANRSDR